MPGDAQRKTILVVDDNLDVRCLVKRLLEMAGYTVIMAADGEEGLRCYERHRSSIVLLLTDVVMPNVGGIELAGRVLEMDSNVSVLLMSGDSRRHYQSWEYLAKPFHPAELVEAVSRAVYASAHS